MPRPIRVVIWAVALALIVVRFVAIDAASHSASDTLRPWVIESAAILAGAWLVLRITEAIVRRRAGPVHR